MDQTRQIRLAADVAQGLRLDEQTVFGVCPALPTSFRDAFCTHFQDIAGSLSQHLRSGAVAIAVEPERGLRGELWLQADDQLRAGIIGRHSRVDLRLDGDSSLSLRHMVLLARGQGEGVHLRLLDLRSNRGLVDEEEQLLQSVEACGPVFVRLSRHLLFVFPTPITVKLPDDPQEAWEALPPRVLIDRRARDPGDAEPIPVGEPWGESSQVTIVPGVVSLEEPLVGPDEGSCGELLFHGDGYDQSLAVGASALDRGVLLGRYRRCDSRDIRAFRDASISRVHGLVVRDGRRVCWIDTASTNRTKSDDRPVRVQQMDEGPGLRLPNGIDVSWSWSM